VKNAKKAGVIIKESNDWVGYMSLLAEVLISHHGVMPVHSTSEIILLHSRFPENIRLFVAEKDGEMLAGCVLYINEVAVHTQYLANSENGRKYYALDLLLYEMIEQFDGRKRFFCFGTSTEADGTFLNAGLLFQKESFGGRAVVHDIWEVPLC
jgi:hypothetical protein